MTEKTRNAIISVSYTHLDVYKRQVNGLAGTAEGEKKKGRRRQTV